MSAPAWQIEEAEPAWLLKRQPDWYLEPREARIKQPRSTIYRASLAVPELIERSTAAEGTATLDMRFAVFGKWKEIDNAAEGHFLERINEGAFRKTIAENFANIRAILSHGTDRSLGQAVLGKIESIREEAGGAVARVSLFPSLQDSCSMV